MNDQQFQPPEHNNVRTLLRVGGPLVALLGLIFIIVGMGSFFSAFNSFESPSYFWCTFIGMPLFMVGIVMCKFGYLGAVVRYIARETAPVAKDTANYVGESTQPGVKAVAKAVTEGVLEARQEQRRPDDQTP